MNKFDLKKFLVENNLTQLGRLSNPMAEEETLDPQMEAEQPVAQESEEEEVQEDYSKYSSVEELMKEIENSTNEAAHKHKMDRVKKAYESLEATATSLEEGEHASYISPAKLKEMKTSAKKLRGMHDKLVKEYEKKFAPKHEKKKSELNEEAGVGMTAQEVADLVGNGPVKLVLHNVRGVAVGSESFKNADEFLRVFAKNDPNREYFETSNGTFLAKYSDKKPNIDQATSASSGDFSDYYASKGSGGFTGD